MGRFDKDHETLEKMFLDLHERVSFLECEIKRLRITPIKLIEARTWALIYELRCRPIINGTVSMSIFDCADFLANGMDDDVLIMPNAKEQTSNVAEIMKLASKKDSEVVFSYIGKKGKPVSRIILKPKETVYTFNDLFKDYS